jgi:hypothetical protein
MDERCRCGEIQRHAYESWRCAGRGHACCPACAEMVESGAHCLPCSRAGVAEAAA